MSIRGLTTQGILDLPDERNETEPSVTIAFALDMGYLECFKVMLYSMAYSKTLLDAPIALYTDDPLLLQDSLVKAIVDKPVLISESRKGVIYNLAKNNVKRPERGQWNKGTFLKWCVFEEQETDQLLFLDVDMICLKPLEPLLQIDPSTRILTCPQFQNNLKDAESDVFHNLKKMLEGEFDSVHTRRVNSGVMAVRKELLDSEFFHEITQYARSSISLHEQGHMSDFFREHPGMLRMVPARYNFQEHYLNAVNSDQQDDLLRDISVLHYAGRSKPWAMRPEQCWRKTLMLWHVYKTCAEPLIRYR